MKQCICKQQKCACGTAPAHCNRACVHNGIVGFALLIKPRLVEFAAAGFSAN